MNSLCTCQSQVHVICLSAFHFLSILLFLLCCLLVSHSVINATGNLSSNYYAFRELFTYLTRPQSAAELRARYFR